KRSITRSTNSSRTERREGGDPPWGRRRGLGRGQLVGAVAAGDLAFLFHGFGDGSPDPFFRWLLEEAPPEVFHQSLTAMPGQPVPRGAFKTDIVFAPDKSLDIPAVERRRRIPGIRPLSHFPDHIGRQAAFGTETGNRLVQDRSRDDEPGNTVLRRVIVPDRYRFKAETGPLIDLAVEPVAEDRIVNPALRQGAVERLLIGVAAAAAPGPPLVVPETGKVVGRLAIP